MSRTVRRCPCEWPQAGHPLAPGDPGGGPRPGGASPTALSVLTRRDAWLLLCPWSRSLSGDHQEQRPSTRWLTPSPVTPDVIATPELSGGGETTTDLRLNYRVINHRCPPRPLECMVRARPHDGASLVPLRLLTTPRMAAKAAAAQRDVSCIPCALAWDGARNIPSDTHLMRRR